MRQRYKFKKSLKKRIHTFNKVGFKELINFYSQYVECLKYGVINGKNYNEVISLTQKKFENNIEKFLNNENKTKAKQIINEILEMFSINFIHVGEIYREKNVIFFYKKLKINTKLFLILIYKKIPKIHPKNKTFYYNKMKKWGEKNEEK